MSIFKIYSELEETKHTVETVYEIIQEIWKILNSGKNVEITVEESDE